MLNCQQCCSAQPHQRQPELHRTQSQRQPWHNMARNKLKTNTLPNRTLHTAYKPPHQESTVYLFLMLHVTTQPSRVHTIGQQNQAMAVCAVHASVGPAASSSSSLSVASKSCVSWMRSDSLPGPSAAALSSPHVCRQPQHTKHVSAQGYMIFFQVSGRVSPTLSSPCSCWSVWVDLEAGTLQELSKLAKAFKLQHQLQSLGRLYVIITV